MKSILKICNKTSKIYNKFIFKLSVLKYEFFLFNVCMKLLYVENPILHKIFRCSLFFHLRMKITFEICL